MPSDEEPEPEAPVTAGLNSINILPFQYFLREGFYNDKDTKWPAGLKGTHFEDPCLVEKAERELIIPPFDAGESIQDAVRELRESIKLLLDHDHDFSATFVPKGDKDLPQTGGDSAAARARSASASMAPLRVAVVDPPEGRRGPCMIGLPSINLPKRRPLSRIRAGELVDTRRSDGRARCVRPGAGGRARGAGSRSCYGTVASVGRGT